MTITSGLSDIVIISAFGRGNWIASELTARGWKVTLTDVSESLAQSSGRMKPFQLEDAEGPFGFFETPDLSITQKSRIIEDSDTKLVEDGFTIWTNEGPIPLRGALSKFALEKNDVPQAVANYLSQTELPNRDSEALRKQVSRKSFDEAWLAHFAHQVMATEFSENHLALANGTAAPVTAPFYIRQVTSQAAEKSLKACESVGIKVRERAAIKDLRVTGKNVDAIEVSDERSGVEKGRSFLWMLTSRETELISKGIFESLYPQGGAAAKWIWARYQVAMSGTLSDDGMPKHSVLVEDPYLPWTHTNLMVLRKRREEKTYDAWIRVPARFQEDKEGLKTFGSEIEAILKKRLPQFEPKVTAQPEAFLISVYDEESLKNLKTLKSPNLYFCTPEQAATLDWTGQFRCQNEVLAKLDKMRAQWLAQEARLEAKHAKAAQP